jgi:hypothetical protein
MNHPLIDLTSVLRRPVELTSQYGPFKDTRLRNQIVGLAGIVY